MSRSGEYTMMARVLHECPFCGKMHLGRVWSSSERRDLCCEAARKAAWKAIAAKAKRGAEMPETWELIGHVGTLQREQSGHIAFVFWHGGFDCYSWEVHCKVKNGQVFVDQGTAAILDEAMSLARERIEAEEG